MTGAAIVLAASLCLAACTPEGIRPQATAAPAPAAVEQARLFEGPYSFAFERSAFDGCWLTMSAAAQARFEAAHPELPMAGRMGGMEFHLKFTGRRMNGGSYGHLGHFSCEIRVETLLESRRTKPVTLPDWPPRSSWD